MELLNQNLDFTFDIVALTETWQLKNNVNFSPPKLQGYQNYEGICESTQKGGCGFYIHESISYVNREELNKQHKGENSEFEATGGNVSSTGGNVIIQLTYRHPKQTILLFYNTLRKHLKS